MEHHEHHHHEQTPLFVDRIASSSFVDDDDNDDNHHHDHHHYTTTASDDIQHMASQGGVASCYNVGINLAKTAAGTGILALPYACKEGGILLFVFGTILISIWNVYGVKRLCDCLQLMVHAKGRYNKWPPPPYGTSTLGKVSYYALGPVGLVLLDIMLLLLLMGIVIAYDVAILDFAHNTPFTTGKNILDATILATLLVPLCIVDDMSNLSRLSRLGLIILAFTIVVIAGYGINGKIQHNNTHDDNIIIIEGGGGTTTTTTLSPFNLLPTNGITGVSHWFGCVVFGFGIVPLTFNFRESMSKPELLPTTALYSMLLVAVGYIFCGIGLLYLYPDIDNDLLSQIPHDGILATITRLAMIVVVMATAPLLIVPCSEIIEGKMMMTCHTNNTNHHYYSTGGGGSSQQQQQQHQVNLRTRIITRTGLCLVTVGIAVILPGFVAVLSFVGCFSVALVSFGVPPFLHWVLLHHQTYSNNNNDAGGGGEGGTAYPLRTAITDLLLFLCGIATTTVTTLYTFRKILMVDEKDTTSPE